MFVFAFAFCDVEEAAATRAFDADADVEDDPLNFGNAPGMSSPGVESALEAMDGLRAISGAWTAYAVFDDWDWGSALGVVTLVEESAFVVCSAHSSEGVGRRWEMLSDIVCVIFGSLTCATTSTEFGIREKILCTANAEDSTSERFYKGRASRLKTVEAGARMYSGAPLLVA